MQALITLAYARPRWSAILRQLFENYQELTTPLAIPVPAGSNAATIHQLATVTLSTGDGGETVSLAVIEIVATNVVDLLRNRVGIRNTAARLLSPGTADGLLIATTQPGEDAWRFTFIHREARLDEQGQLVRAETAPRRYTYLLGPDESCRTPADRFNLLARHRGATTLSHVLDAFSVEKLNREFFETYLRHYRAFCGHLLSSDAVEGIFGISLAGLEGKARDRALKPVRDFVKKLLGRLVFLHFLQKKGWLGCPALSGDQATLPQEEMPWLHGVSDFLRQLFNTAPQAEKDRFHSSRLLPLFFDRLNQPDRPGLLFSVTGSRVPYLNGGLFERDFAGVEQVDFPASLFDGLLEFFSHYHFTIDENDPEDHEIGIDPEMLGHIFENLLEDNKDKGAYYTPKAVVQYMCQQSLIHALAGRFPDDAEARTEIEKLIRLKDPIEPLAAAALPGIILSESFLP